MRLYLYVFDADAEPSLLEEVTDIEEAVADCQELVAVDGYPRAEVWSGMGDRLYGVARRGGALLTYGTPQSADEDEEERPGPVLRASCRPAAPSPAAPGGRSNGSGREERSAARDPDDLPQPDAPTGPQRLFGEQPGRTEQWFGM